MSLSTPIPANYRLAYVALGVVCLTATVWCNAARGDTAAEVYRQKCAYCHGQQGQGVADLYDSPLYGDKSIEELADFIEESMPEGDAEDCVGDEAAQVATYIFREFYSPVVRREQGLLADQRVELTRLTAGQYRNAVADLIGYFTPPPRASRKGGDKDQPADDERKQTPESGLRAEYFQSDGMNKADELHMERIDRSIDFEFGTQSPAPKITPDQFAIIWRGTIAAPHTGDYEFRVRTPNGVRLYLNCDGLARDGKLRDDSSNMRQPAFIDAWVSSGKLREHTGRVFLLGGRSYPIRLEFFKYMEPEASIRLEWKPPHGVWSVIDDDYLIVQPSSRTWVVDTPLPADDRSLGYERGSSVSQEWHAATTSAAVAAAEEVIDRLPLLARVKDDAADHDAKLGEFLSRFASVAYRRPLKPDEEHLYREVIFADAPAAEAAVRRALLLTLNSPHFLYSDLTPAGEPPSQHTIASRLAFALWDSIPDTKLFKAAERGELANRRQIEQQARRMLSDPRSKQKMRTFFQYWLELEERDLAKDEEMYPEFDEAVIADLRRSLELFVEHVVWSEDSDYRELLLADYLLLNGRLRHVYQDELEICDEDELSTDDAQPSVSPRQEFAVVRCAPTRRSGILTHPYLLSAFAYHNNTSPIHRGVFLTRNIVGRSLKPPPVAVAFHDGDFDPELTMREKVTELTREKACMGCHSVINPLGFALENFDAVGRWRTLENDKPIDPRSDYTTESGSTLQLASARDIANFAVASESAQRAFVTQLFQHLVKQNPDAFGPDVIDRLRNGFADEGFHIQNLMVRIATIAAAHDPHSNPELEVMP